MGDRIISNDIELIPFFGKLAPFDSSPFRIAVAKKASLSFSFGARFSDESYQLLISDANKLLNSEGLNRHLYVYRQMSDYVKSIEDLLGIKLIDDDISDEQKSLIKERLKARDSKDWEKSDSIRDELKDQGIIIEDMKPVQIWSRVR